MPVDLDRAGDVAGVVEQDVLVGLDDGETGPADVAGQPVGGDQPFGVGVGGEGGMRVCGQRHPASLPDGQPRAPRR